MLVYLCVYGYMHACIYVCTMHIVHVYVYMYLYMYVCNIILIRNIILYITNILSILFNKCIKMVVPLM